MHQNDFEKLPLFFTKHFCERWDKRVFKSNKKGIDSFLKEQITKGNIKHKTGDLFLVDNDIVVIAVKRGKKIVLISTLGRVSNNPFLNNLQYLPLVYKKYGKMTIY